jgi:hypothetical protein
VTVPAVDSVTADVALVTELNWLLARNSSFGHPRRSIDGGGQNKDTDANKESAEKRYTRNGVRTAMEDLRHRLNGCSRFDLMALSLYTS